MIAHVVTFTWREGTDPADVEGIGLDLQTMASAIPEILFYRAGDNLRLRPNGADFAVVAVVADQAGLDAYLDAPAHVELVAQRMAPYIDTRQAVQLMIDGDDLPAWLA